MTLFGRKTRRLGRLLSDGFLQFLGGAESPLLARLDLDGLARGGVAADAGGALADLEDARRCGYARPFSGAWCLWSPGRSGWFRPASWTAPAPRRWPRRGA